MEEMPLVLLAFPFVLIFFDTWMMILSFILFHRTACDKEVNSIGEYSTVGSLDG